MCELFSGTFSGPCVLCSLVEVCSFIFFRNLWKFTFWPQYKSSDTNQWNWARRREEGENRDTKTDRQRDFLSKMIQSSVIIAVTAIWFNSSRFLVCCLGGCVCVCVKWVCMNAPVCLSGCVWTQLHLTKTDPKKNKTTLCKRKFNFIKLMLPFNNFIHRFSQTHVRLLPH